MASDKDLNGRTNLKDEPTLIGAGQVQDGVEPEALDDVLGDVQQEDYDILKERLSQKEAEAAEYLDKLKRVQAEMENFRKRMLKEQEQIIQYAAQTIIRELLPVIDNLERALEASKGDVDGGKLLEGVELIYSQLKDLLARECVEVIDPLGDEFDPQKHEAVMQVESDEHEENAVAEVLQKGYELRGRLLRPAIVKVAR
ncbi:MAG: nucleotide exchange factor GrpE [Actinobacteria bacterium]|nr:nucleotide exchange factor GrpE [Actinomycetota bacterium]